MKSHHLTITYGTSRGADTYGYTLVTLRENGHKKASTCGGGYDMRGTVFADWLQQEYQERLLAIAKRGKFKRVVWNGKSGDASKYTNPDADKREALYGASYYSKGSEDWETKKLKPARVTLDGGCGFSSIQRIAEAIGLIIQTVDAGKKCDVVIVTDTRA